MTHKDIKQDNVIKGMACAICAFFLLAVMNTFAKMLSDTHHVIEIAFYRNIIASLPFLFIIFVMKKRSIVKINQRPFGVIARAVIGVISLIVTFAAFAAMPMADVTAFLFTASLLVPVMGIIFLKEKVGIYRWAAIIIGFVGVLIMLNPGDDMNKVGVALALIAASMHATLGIILRHIGQTEKPETIVFYFVTIGTVIAGLMMPWVATIPQMVDVPLLIGVGLSGLIAQYFLSAAFGNAPAAIVTVFNYSGIIWATLFGWVIWQDWPAPAIWIGGSIVIASNLFMVWREHRLNKTESLKAKAKAKII
jgi:drug/metabolite transporter (DMT)-like permease